MNGRQNYIFCIAIAVAIGLLAVAVAPIVYTIVTADFPGSSLMYGWQEDSTQVLLLLRLSHLLRTPSAWIMLSVVLIIAIALRAGGK